MTEWKFSLHSEALKVFLSTTRTEQGRLLAFFEKLAQSPETVADFTERDDSQRVILARVVGKHAVYWWLDSPVNEIKIVHLRPADR